MDFSQGMEGEGGTSQRQGSTYSLAVLPASACGFHVGDKMAARGSVRKKKQVAAAVGTAPLFKDSSQKSHTILPCKS